MVLPLRISIAACTGTLFFALVWKLFSPAEVSASLQPDEGMPVQSDVENTAPPVFKGAPLQEREPKVAAVELEAREPASKPPAPEIEIARVVVPASSTALYDAVMANNVPLAITLLGLGDACSLRHG